MHLVLDRGGDTRLVLPVKLILQIRVLCIKARTSVTYLPPPEHQRRGPPQGWHPSVQKGLGERGHAAAHQRRRSHPALCALISSGGPDGPRPPADSLEGCDVESAVPTNISLSCAAGGTAYNGAARMIQRATRDEINRPWPIDLISWIYLMPRTAPVSLESGSRVALIWSESHAADPW